MRSRRRRADLRVSISGVIQGVGAVREDLLVLVRSGRDDRVVSEGLRKISRRSGKQLGGFVMRGLELRSSMNLG